MIKEGQRVVAKTAGAAYAHRLTPMPAPRTGPSSFTPLLSANGGRGVGGGYAPNPNPGNRNSGAPRSGGGGGAGGAAGVGTGARSGAGARSNINNPVELGCSIRLDG